MAKTTSNLISALSNSKTRTFVILFGAVIVVGVGIAVLGGGKKGEDLLSKQGSQAVTVPSTIRATPGSVVPEKYQEYQRAENERRAQEAAKKKTSAIPTIIGAIADSTGKENPDAAALDVALKQQSTNKLPLGAEEGAFAGGVAFGKSPREKEREAQEARLKEQQARLDKQRAEQERQKELERQRRLAQQQEKEYQAELQKISNQMKNYASGAYAEWSKYTPQQFVQGELADKEFKRSQPDYLTQDGRGVTTTTTSDGTVVTRKSTTSSRAGSPVSKKIFIKAGTILFAVMDSAVNSDEPGPVLATIVSGKYSGGKLIGTFQHAAQQESVIISFETMTIPKRSKSFSVKAVAVDPDTAKTAMATDVDRHFFLRYGMLFASSFIQGYGQAVQSQGQTTVVSPLTGSVTTTQSNLDNRQIFFAALGELGKQWSAAIKPYFNTPYTVTVDQGTSVGILFLSDVEIIEDVGQGAGAIK